ncbi:thiolase family protein [Neobacillus sp. C211]|uniref:thiolase family protein n=1 Tax=unclassified Neobacillus TaxID=2675272 RepID=UPI00397B7FBE
MKGKAAIVGIGETNYEKDSGKNILQLASEATKYALADANLSIRDIDGIITLCPLSTSARLNNVLASYLELKPTYSAEVAVYGASGGTALKQAAEAIAAKAAKRILVVGSDKNFLKVQSNGPQILGGAYQQKFISAEATPSYAMAANLHQHLYQSTNEQRAKIAVDQRFNANHFDNALFKDKKLNLEDVFTSPIIAEPIHIMEIVYPCDGAVAFIVTSNDDAKSITKTPVAIDGAGFYNSHFLYTESEMFTNGLVTGVKKAGDIAYKMAGIGPEQIQICGLYDCYTIAVMLMLEDLGFCQKGQGGNFVEEHDLTFKGDFPVNTSGGQLSAGQPGDAGGMVNIVEVVRQLMGKSGIRQIADVEYGITTSNGGYFSNECVLILRGNR